MNIKSDNLYIFISVIIIIALLFIFNKKYNLSKNDFYENQNILHFDKNDLCMIEIDGKIIKINKQDLNKHLMTIKNNLNSYSNIQNYDLALADIKKFNYNQPDEKLSFLENYRKELLKKIKDDNIINMQKVDFSEDSSNENKQKLLLELDICIILIKDGTENILILTNLHKLVQNLKIPDFINLNDTQESETINENFENNLYKISSDDISNDDISGNGIIVQKKSYANPLIKQGINSSYFSQDIKNAYGNLKYDGEEYCNDNDTILYSMKSKTKKTFSPNNKDFCSQLLNNSEENKIYLKNGIKNYKTFCDIDKARYERQLMKEKTLDLNCVRSLRNDYDFLDL